MYQRTSQFELLNFGVERGELAVQEDVGMPSWVANHFEFRPTVHLTIDDQHVDIIGRPMQELSRIFHHIIEREGFYVDVAILFMDIHLSMIKAFLNIDFFDYEWLSALQPFALGIGRNELIAGVDNFLNEIADLDLPYIATNLNPPEKYEGKTLPTHKVHTITHETGNSSSVLFLSILIQNGLNKFLKLKPKVGK